MIPKQMKKPESPDFLSGLVSNSKASLLTFHAKYTVMYVHKTITNTNPISSPNHPKTFIKSIPIIVAIIAKINGSNINTKISIPKTFFIL